MRPITQFQVVEEGEETFTVVALDEDGYLWHGVVTYRLAGPLEAAWTAIRGPKDDPPFMDTRSHLDRLEDEIRDRVEQREALQQHLDSLPKAGGERDSETVT